MPVAKIAEGEAEAAFSFNKNASKWDYCTPEVILSEAGGALTYLNGESLDYSVSDQDFKSMTLASNNLVHREMLETFSKWKGGHGT